MIERFTGHLFVAALFLLFLIADGLARLIGLALGALLARAIRG